MWYTYILKSTIDNKLYIGSTNNIERRLKEHNNKEVNSTSPRAPFDLICYIAFQSEQKARKHEQYLKTGSGRAFITKRIL